MVSAREKELNVKQAIEEDLLKIPGVAGVGFSKKSPAKIRIYVERVTNQILETIPAQLGGVDTEIIESGKFIALQDRTGRWRPSPGGVSIGNVGISAGTHGATLLLNNQKVILSNAHVLTVDPTATGTSERDILQPGAFDGGIIPDDLIAQLSAWVPLDINNPNLIDSATATPSQQDLVSTEILGLGFIQGLSNPTVGMQVIKSGRTSGVTGGEIQDIDATVLVDYGLGEPISFTDQIVTSRMVEPGDSGSVLLSTGNRLVGLSFAGSDSFSIHNKISNVISTFNLTIPSPRGGIIPFSGGSGVGGFIALGLLLVTSRFFRKPKKKR